MTDTARDNHNAAWSDGANPIANPGSCMALKNTEEGFQVVMVSRNIKRLHGDSRYFRENYRQRLANDRLELNASSTHPRDGFEFCYKLRGGPRGRPSHLRGFGRNNWGNVEAKDFVRARNTSDREGALGRNDHYAPRSKYTALRRYLNSDFPFELKYNMLLCLAIHSNR